MAATDARTEALRRINAGCAEGCTHVIARLLADLDTLTARLAESEQAIQHVPIDPPVDIEAGRRYAIVDAEDYSQLQAKLAAVEQERDALKVRVAEQRTLLDLLSPPTKADA
jgi:uncharacterized coiled-coil protein SlyX